MNQDFSKIWIAVVSFILIGGGILAYQYWWIPRQEVKVPEEEIADWKTYRNEKYGYEIKYPFSWQKDEAYQGPEEAVFSDTQSWGNALIVYARVFVRAQKVSEDFVNGWNAEILSRPEERKFKEIGGFRAVEEEFDYPDEETKVYTFVSEQTLVQYRIVTTIHDVKNYPVPGGGTIPDDIIDLDKTPLLYREIFNQIFSTFKFLD